MGVAAGKFVPTTGYAMIQGLVGAAKGGSQAHLGLGVRLIGGEPIPAQGGLLILDYSAELGDDGIEIEVLGIPHPLYEQLFPQRGGRPERPSP
jgi:hypothetical protein